MRKVVASVLMSVDGVVESSEERQLPYFNDEMGGGDRGRDGPNCRYATRKGDLRGVGRFLAFPE